MAFVYEVVPEADRKLFNGLGFKDALHRPMAADGYVYWTIDRQRDAILVGLGGGRAGGEEYSQVPAVYNLVWHGQWIAFDFFRRGRGNGLSGVEQWRKFQNINVPEPLRDRKEEILQLITEALHAEDGRNGRIKVTAFHNEFSQPTFY